MAGITHKFVSAKDDGADNTVVRPSNWNDSHDVEQVITDNAVVTVDQADAASGEYAKFTANGIESKSIAEVNADLGVTAVFNSKVRATQTADQPLPTATTVIVALGTETFDLLGEFNNTITTGTASATSSGHLVNASASFTAADVGKQIWNTTDNTYALVTACNSSTDLTLSGNIMANGEGYKMYFCSFTPAVNGYYQVSGNILIADMADQKKLSLFLYVDAVAVSNAVTITSAAQWYTVHIADLLYLTTSNKLQLAFQHENGTTRTISYYPGTNMSIARVG